MKNSLVSTLLILIGSFGFTQENRYSNNPAEAKFITADYERFWKAFDKVEETTANPFVEYLKKASEGFSPYVRYFDADTLYKTVKERKGDYLKSRYVLDGLGEKETEIKDVYTKMKDWHAGAQFPPVYFVVGMFTSGGTVTDKGLLIGAEKLENLNGLTGLVAHELIHYQQNITGKDNLLKQAILEGSADFIGELISGQHINKVPFEYGTKNEVKLCEEFVKVMHKEDYTDWLYGTSGKDDRPNDLGYWMGYKITEAYFDRQADKQLAIHAILNIEEPEVFLKKAGYLEKFMTDE